MARRLGVGYQTVMRWELGQTRPRQAHISKYAALLRLPPVRALKWYMAVKTDDLAKITRFGQKMAILAATITTKPI